jgi:quinol-cytochrome oxidoreductase complex cytochrome b subunit
MRPTFFHHIHPPSIPALQARFRYTLAAGGLAIFLMLVLGITGILEIFYYVPTPAEAAQSIQTLTFLVPFGGVIRNLHYWSAQFFLVVTAIHLFRVVMTGSYAPPRQLNYLIGMGLFLFAVLLDFTGYILRWDEGIHWALVTGTNLLKTIPGIGSLLYNAVVGGTLPGPATLLRFYGWHIFGLAAGALILVVWHVFRVRRDGGIAVPPPRLRPSQERISRFELVRREVLAMLLTLAALLLLSVFVPAPLAAPLTDSSTITASAKAPWFFLWVQQMLKWGNPFLWGVLVPVILFLLVVSLPYLFPKVEPGQFGKWFPHSARLAQIIALIVFLFVLLLSILAVLPFS